MISVPVRRMASSIHILVSDQTIDVDLYNIATWKELAMREILSEMVVDPYRERILIISRNQPPVQIYGDIQDAVLMYVCEQILRGRAKAGSLSLPLQLVLEETGLKRAEVPHGFVIKDFFALAGNNSFIMIRSRGT